MTLFEEDLITYLKANAGLSAKVSSRIHSMHNPQNVVLPAITYQRVSTTRLLTHDLNSETLSSPRIQFDVYASDYKSSLEVVQELREALQGYKGMMGNTKVQASLPMLEQHSDDEDLNIYRCTIDYMISYQEV